MTNETEITRKNKVADDYIAKIADKSEFFSNKGFYGIQEELGKMKELINISGEKTEETDEINQKTHEQLKDFLVTENIIEGITDDFIGEGKLTILGGVSKGGMDALKEAKKIINSKDQTDGNAREELELTQTQNDTTQTTNNETETNINYIPGLSATENKNLEDLKTESQTPNTINYLEDSTYKKYLNTIEAELSLPKETLQSVCLAESAGRLYKGNDLIGSHAGAQGLFQFMPGTARHYMKHKMLKEKYGKKFKNKQDFLKDPLASARASGIMLSENMKKYGYDLPTTLAGYNRGPGNVNKICPKTSYGRHLSGENFGKLPEETQNYVKKISNNILKLNGKQETTDTSDLLSSVGNVEAPQMSGKKESIRVGSPIEANKDKNKENPASFGGLGNSIMDGFEFGEMDGISSKTTQNHENKFKTKQDVEKYKEGHTEVKSFLMYFGVNALSIYGPKNGRKKTIDDLRQRGRWLQESDIQPVLSTCIGDKNYPDLKIPKLNKKIVALGKELGCPVLDFASKESQIAMGSNKHPTDVGYNTMKSMITAA